MSANVALNNKLLKFMFQAIFTVAPEAVTIKFMNNISCLKYPGQSLEATEMSNASDNVCTS